MKTNAPKPKRSKKSSKSKRRSTHDQELWRPREERIAARAARINADRSKAKGRAIKNRLKAEKEAANPSPAAKAKEAASAKTAAIHVLRRWLSRPDVTLYASDPNFIHQFEYSLNSLIPDHLVAP